VASGGAALPDPVANAARFGGLFGNAKAGARNLLNYLTYYQMKKRAGTVGAGGVHTLLRNLKQAHPSLKLHLVGHSFGGRLVSAAARGAETGPALRFESMALLQAAFSHNGFAEKFDEEHDGFFRRVVADKRVTGPILITHTENDKAVGIAYALASRFAHQTAAGLGDANDVFGGIGRNGAQKMRPNEVQTAELLAPNGEYAFSKGKIFNLLADKFISSHGDVASASVAQALLAGIAAT
jgi:pimeloyl-ACP methyl ester carboxylesterase